LHINFDLKELRHLSSHHSWLLFEIY